MTQWDVLIPFTNGQVLLDMLEEPGFPVFTNIIDLYVTNMKRILFNSKINYNNNNNRHLYYSSTVSQSGQGEKP